MGYSWGVGVHLAELTLQGTTYIETVGKVKNRDDSAICLGMEWHLGEIGFYIKTSFYPVLLGRYGVQKQGVCVGRGIESDEAESMWPYILTVWRWSC